MYGNGGVQKDSPVSHICRKDCSPKGIEELASKLKPWGVESSKDTSVRSKALDDQLGQQPPPRNTPESCVTTFLASHPASAVADPSASACEPSSRDRLGIETADQQARRSRCIVGSTLRPNMNSMPAEVQQMIWAEVIRAPACHTFKVKKGAVTEEGSRWSVHLCPGSAREDLDSSAYHQWKSLLSLHNIGFQTAFRRFIKNIQPTPLRLPRCGNSKYKAINFYKTVAAINEEQDLVILEFERGQSLPWFEHTNHRHGMHWQLIQSRMSHFRQVAIHYKHGHMECSHGGAFACLCHTANQPHDCYKACPLTLASFLDLFPNLQQFYFVVEQRLAYHKKFAAAYREKVAGTDFRAQIDHPGGAKAIGKQFTLPHFFDTATEYLQQAPDPYLQAWKMQSPWAGDESALECLVETLQFYKSQKGNEAFRQSLEKRVKARFGILIPYPLEHSKKVKAAH